MIKFSQDEKPALVLIGFQQGLDEIEYWGPQRNHPDAERNAQQLLDVWRNTAFPIIHIQQISSNSDSPLHTGKPGSDFKQELKPWDGEHVIANMDNRCTGADMRRILSEYNVKKVVFAGVPTDHCVSSAIHMVSTYGYEAYVVYDATATFGRPNPRIQQRMYSAELIHDTTLASINNKFASVVMSSDLIEVLHVDIGVKK